MAMRRGTAWLCLIFTCGLVACGDDESGGGKHAMKDAGGSSRHDDAGDADAASDADIVMTVDAGPSPTADLDELLDMGIADYLGKAKPTKHETITGNASVADG